MKDVRKNNQKKSTKHKKARSSNKGALIKGMSRRLPSEILGNPTFKQRLKEIMKRYAGIYALYRREKLYYVGLTTNLHGRIKWHLKDRHKGKWNKFIIFRIQKVRYLKDVETLIHHIIDTPGNKVKGKVPKDADLNKILKDVLQEHEKAIKGIKTALK